MDNIFLEDRTINVSHTISSLLTTPSSLLPLPSQNALATNKLHSKVIEPSEESNVERLEEFQSTAVTELSTLPTTSNSIQTSISSGIPSSSTVTTDEDENLYRFINFFFIQGKSTIFFYLASFISIF